MRLEDYIEKYGEELGKVKYENHLEANRQYRLKNKEKIKLLKQQWNDKNKENVKLKKKEYYEQHKEEISLKNKELYKNEDYRLNRLQKVHEYIELNRDKVLDKNRNYYKENRDILLAKSKERNQKPEAKIKMRDYSRKRRMDPEFKEYEKYKMHDYWDRDRKLGKSPYCSVNYELIENYELAKADEFDPMKWHLHHRLENYWSSDTLMKKGIYFNVNPEALIWLPYEEHMKDRYCKNSKWHKRSLENG
jgi:hypothetical protein